MPLVPLNSTAQGPPGTVTELESNDSVYAICNVNGKLHALDGVCPHAGGPLSQGTLHGSTLVCPWHGWEFDALTGECLVGDESRLRTYKIVQQNSEAFIELP